MRWPWQKETDVNGDRYLVEALKAAEEEHDLLVLALTARIEKRSHDAAKEKK